MTIDILTLFPEMFEPLKTSLIGKAQDKKQQMVSVPRLELPGWRGTVQMHP